MNILVISHRIPYPANKGEKIRTFNQIKHLAEQNHTVSIISPIEEDIEAEFAGQLSEFDNITVVTKKLTVKPLRLLKGMIQQKALSVANFYTKSLQALIDEHINAEVYDAIICTSSAMAEYIYQSKVFETLKLKPMLLMDFMDLDSDKWQQYASKSSFPMKWVYQREAKTLSAYEYAIQKKFDACFFIADAEVNLFKQQNNQIENVFTLGNGLNTKEFYPAKSSPDNASPVFIFTGVMDYKPNVDAVVWFVENVWSGILERYSEARFIIAGMNPNKQVLELKKFVGIEVTGYVDDILPYYHQADYFVAPFRLARGVQNKVLQAFACGLPVISTPMGAEGIDCQHNKDILIVEQPNEFVDCLNMLECNDDLKNALKKNALSLINDHYSWEGKLKVLDNILSHR